MRLLSFKLNDYKSIKKTGEISFHDKINIFAGKNNTGKTAFIESIYRVIQGNLNDSFLFNDSVELQLEISVSDEELALLYNNVDSDYVIREVDKFKIFFRYDVQQNYSRLNKIEMFHDNKYKPFYTNKTTANKIEYVINNEKGGGVTSVGGIPIFITNLREFLSEKIVYISGSRYIPESEETALSDTLSIDGTNLNKFLYTLHNNNEEIFDKIKTTFIEIFNEVESINTPINIGNTTNISVIFKEYNKPIPLSSCGSGFSHVLLLLCVLYTKQDSIVLYDEPQVYLHPSAEKAIYDLISENEGHQYLLTTHSPILINYPFDKYIFHVRKDKGHSVFTQLDKMQEILSDIGVNNSDFALSDKVIFVEGETEELVIPKILSHFGLKQIGYNYRILKMNGTGNEFSKKSAMTRHKEKLELILGGISDSPIPYKIIIDSDEKSEEKINEIKEKYGENIVVLERREFENFFLDCYEELSELINENGDAVSNSEEIKTKIEVILSDKTDKKLYPKESLNPIVNVVGSEVLERLFDDYSMTYNKITHGLKLTNMILQNTPENLEFFKCEFEDFING